MPSSTIPMYLRFLRWYTSFIFEDILTFSMSRDLFSKIDRGGVMKLLLKVIEQGSKNMTIRKLSVPHFQVKIFTVISHFQVTWQKLPVNKFIKLLIITIPNYSPSFKFQEEWTNISPSNKNMSNNQPGQALTYLRVFCHTWECFHNLVKYPVDHQIKYTSN